MKPRRNGITPIDWVVSFLFFIMIVFISLYYMSYISRSQQPYEAPLESQLVDLSASLEEQLAWTAYRVPLVVESGYFLHNYPLFIDYGINSLTKNSTYVFDESGNVLTTEVDVNGSKVFWVSDIFEGENRFYLFYITDSSLNESVNSTLCDFVAGDMTVANTYISVEFDNFSITSLMFNSREFVNGGVLLNTANEPLIINNPIRATASYTGNVSVVLFMNGSRIRVHSESPGDFVLHLDDYLTRFYAEGSSYAFNGTNGFEGVTDFVDLYNNTGISVIGRNLNVSVNDTGGTRDVYLFNETDFELYLHDGGFLNMLNESAVYPDGPGILIGLPQKVSGIREDRIAELEQLYYDELAERLQIDDLGVLVRIENPES